MVKWTKILAMIVCVSIAASFFACGKENGANNNFRRQGMGGGWDMSGSGTAAIPVQVTPVKRGDISMFLLYTTTIEAEREVDVIAKVSGQVIKLPVEEGTKVKQGDLLAQLDEAELKIELLQARVRMETDKAAFERAKNMLEKNLIAEEQYETARLQYENSKAAYEAAKLKVEYTSVRSPINGVVTQRMVELGQRVNVNQVLFRVADFEPLRAKIYVPEKDIHKIFVGQKARLTIESQPEAEFIGTVKMISPVVDPTTGTAKVTIDIENHGGRLKPGMFASVYINTDTHRNTLLIPKKALLLESETDQVFVYDNGVARKANLKLGFISGDWVEVLSGLKEGDLVVTIGQEGLREGLPLKIPEQTAGLTSTSTDSVTRSIAKSQATANNTKKQPQGKIAFGQPNPERLKRMEERLLSIPEIRKEYEKRLKKDPELKDNPEKKMAFFREMFQKMRGRRHR